MPQLQLPKVLEMFATGRPIHLYASLACAFLLCGAIASGISVARSEADPPLGKSPGAVVPLPAFPNWPKGTNPEAAIAITGQTYGYLQPCGCSRPQLGGLERRANLLSAMKAAGWPVVGIDLGDILPVAGVVADQVVLKYRTSMNALREMGYVAVGAGRAEFANGFYRVLSQYAATNVQPPFTLAANVGGLSGGKVTPRADAFPGPGDAPMVGSIQVSQVGTLAIGVACVVGPTVAGAVDRPGSKSLVGFTSPDDSLALAVKELARDPKKPQLNVLLYQGTLDEARVVAKAWPQFSAVVCLSADSEPPQNAEVVRGTDGKETFIVQVGYKGRYLGILGAFKKPAGGLELKYQLVPLGEAFITPGDEEAAQRTNPVLPILEDYSAQVKARKYLEKFPQGPHPSQAVAANLAFVGAEKCATCHRVEHDSWKTSKHAHALESLEKVARRPSLRNFDGECVVCHATGFGYKTGYRNDATTPNLRHIGCESCHGPGSGHVADPKDPKLLALQSPWRMEREDRLPDLEAMAALAKLKDDAREKVLSPVQKRMVSAVTRACTACHDSENDPNFDLVSYWPKIQHAAKK